MTAPRDPSAAREARFRLDARMRSQRDRGAALLAALGPVGGVDRPGVAQGEAPASFARSEGAERPVSRPKGPSAPSGRVILDTLQTTLGPPEITQLSIADAPPYRPGGTHWYGGTEALAPAGQVVLLPTEPAQLALDGTPMAPLGSCGNPLPQPGDASELPHVPSHAQQQLAFEFSRNGVQMTFENWQRECARALDWLGRTDRAERIRNCGSMVVMEQCARCSGFDTANSKRSSDCMASVCPCCARKKAEKQRALLGRAFKRWRYQRRGKSWWLHTITSRPTGTQNGRYGTSIERLRVDFERVAAIVLRLWHWLRDHENCERMAAHFEISQGGMVHCHMMAYHKGVFAKRFARLRAALVDPKPGEPREFNLNTKRATKGGCAEVAKYITKGVARNDNQANQTHPLLSALVDVALFGRQTWRTYGKWDGVEEEPEHENWACPFCGGHEHRAAYMTHEQRAAIAARQQGATAA